MDRPNNNLNVKPHPAKEKNSNEKIAETHTHTHTRQIKTLPTTFKPTYYAKKKKKLRQTSRVKKNVNNDHIPLTHTPRRKYCPAGGRGGRWEATLERGTECHKKSKKPVLPRMCTGRCPEKPQDRVRKSRSRNKTGKNYTACYSQKKKKKNKLDGHPTQSITFHQDRPTRQERNKK